MAEARRIPLESVKVVPKEKKEIEQEKTLRFSFALVESNEKSCPEFSYTELVRTSTKEKKDSQNEDPYGEEEDDKKLQDIARKFEEKYGPKCPKKSKNKKTERWEDYIDRGLGYDESDPFIDNNEAYDELVPSTLTTQFGGFYINSGELEFRNVSESESTDVFKPRKKRRRILEKGITKKKYWTKDGQEVKNEIPSIPKKRGRKPLDRSATASVSADESALNKMRRKSQPTVAALLQERKAQLQQLTMPEEKASYGQSSGSVFPQNGPDNLMDDVGDESPLPVPIIASSSDEMDGSLDMFGRGELSSNINDIIESVVKNAEDILNNGNFFLSGSSDSEDVKKGGKSIDAPKLPENLPSDLTDLVFKIKQAALITAEGKCKFFSGDVNRMLLSIEMKSRELSCTQRSMIYSHLASFLPCTKETLLKRAKKLRLDQEGGKLANPMQRLQDAVNKVLPAMLEKYELSCLTSKSIKTVDGTAAISRTENENQEMPKKKFDWNDKLRGLLCEVVRIKLKCYEVLKMRTQSAEEFLYQFLDFEVRQLWPTDWMSTRILLKESRSAHAYITSNKSRKPWIVVKKLSSTGTPLIPIVNTNILPNTIQNLPKHSSTSQEMAAAASIMALAGAGSSSPAYQAEEGEFEDSFDSQSSSKLVIASPQPPTEIDLTIDKEPIVISKAVTEQQVTSSSRLLSENIVPHRAALAEAAKLKADVYAEPVFPIDKVKPTANILPVATTLSTSTTSPLTSPKKRIFTLMNSDDAAHLQAQQSTQQTSFAAQMLDRIICQSLANFPNSGSTLAMPEIGGKPIKADLQTTSDNIKNSGLLLPEVIGGLRTVKTDLIVSEQGSTSKVSNSMLLGDFQSKNGNSGSSTIATAAAGVLNNPTSHHGAVSILKSNYSQPTASASTPTTQSSRSSSSRTTVLDHGSNITATTVKSSSVNSAVILKGGSQALSSMPYQAYEFQEAFKRSLGINQSRSAIGNSEATPSSRTIPYASTGLASSSSRHSVARKITNESLEEPMNFSTSSSSAAAVTAQHQVTAAHYTASQELNRLASVSLTVQPQQSQTQRASRTHRTSPDQSFSSGMVFPEGMKGFPMPLKTSSSTNSSSNQQSPLHPPPAHSYPPRRMSPNESGFTTSGRPSPKSPLQSSNTRTSPVTAPSISVSAGHVVNHSLPYQSTPTLTHYSAAEATHALSMPYLDDWQGNWQSSSATPLTPTYSTPSQYSASGSHVMAQATSNSYTVPAISHIQASTASAYSLPTSPLTQRGAINVVHKSPNIPAPAHQPTNPSKSANRNVVYNNVFVGQHPNSQRSNQQSSHQRIP